MYNLVGYFDYYWNPEIVHLRYNSSIHILYVHDTFIFFSAVITPCASGNVLLKVHWFYCIKHHWEITHLLSTYFPLTKIYIYLVAFYRWISQFLSTNSRLAQNIYCILKLHKVCLLQNICTLLHHKYNIIISNHSHCIRYKHNINITILKLRT